MSEILSKIALISFLVFAVVSCQQKNKIVEEIVKHKQLNHYFEKLEQNGFSGAVLVVQNDTILLQKGYGLANKDLEIKNSVNTVFNCASIGKQFTAAAILKLYEELSLQLDDPIEKYLKSYSNTKIGKVTIHQLLTHTSGIEDYDRPAGIQLNKQEFLDEVLKVQSEDLYKQEFSYSNTGYELLSIIVENNTNVSFREYLTSTFFMPLGLTSTGFIGDSVWAKDRVAKGSGGVNNHLAFQGDISYGNIGSGNIVTSIIDLFKWEKAIRNNSVFNANLTELWFKPHVTAEIDRLKYGYGWRHNTTERNTSLIWHTGWEDAFSGLYYRFIDEKTTMIILSNHAVGMNPSTRTIFPILRTSEAESIIFNSNHKEDKTLVQEDLGNLNFPEGDYVSKAGVIKISKNPNTSKSFHANIYGQDLINKLFDYTKEEIKEIDSINTKITSYSSNFMGGKVSLKALVDSLGMFDEYRFFGKGNTWVENHLKNEIQNRGPINSIELRGTLHTTGNRFSRKASNICFVHQKDTIQYDYVNFDDEKYLIYGGTNAFNFSIIYDDKKKRWYLSDLMKRFPDHEINVDIDHNSLTIIRGKLNLTLIKER